MSARDYFSRKSWVKAADKHAENFSENVQGFTWKSGFTFIVASGFDKAAIKNYPVVGPVIKGRDAATKTVGQLADKAIGNRKVQSSQDFVQSNTKYNDTQLWDAGEKLASGAIASGTWIFWHGVSTGLTSGLQALANGKGIVKSFKIGAHDGIEQGKYDFYMVSEFTQAAFDYTMGYTVGLAGDAVAWGWSNTFGRFEDAVKPSGEDVTA